MMFATQMLEGKVGLITGAGSGIGEATAILMARQGAAVALVDRHRDAVERVAEGLREEGHRVIALTADVSRSAEVDGMVEEVVTTFGRLDCAVNNAGVQGPLKSLMDYTDDDWRTVVGINMDGVFYSMRAEVRAMLASGGGAIVNIASTAAVTGLPMIPAYVASKSGVMGLTRAAAAEFAAADVRINAVVPGRTTTPLMRTAIEQTSRAETPETHRYGDPSEIAEAIVWLCSPLSSYVHGERLVVDGGGSAYRAPELIGTRDYDARRASFGAGSWG